MFLSTPSAAATEQAAECAADEVAPDAAHFGFDDLLHQSVVVAAARAGAAKEFFFAGGEELVEEAGAFLLLHAPDVAISEAAVGAALSPLIFIVALKKIRGGDDK